MAIILVTGAAGFIGSHVVDQLLANGHDVIGVDSFAPYYAASLKHRNIDDARNHRRFHLFPETLETFDLSSILPKVESVIHLAAQPGVRASWDQLLTYTNANIVAFGNVLNHCVQHRPKRIVFASSSSVYGNTPHGPIAISQPIAPVSPYGMTKAAGELLAHSYATTYELPITILRYFTVYGPRQRPDMLISRLINSTISTEAVPLYGDGTAERDFTYVTDVANATIKAATTDLPPGTTLNIASSSPTSINDLVKLITGIAGRQPNLNPTGPTAGDVAHTWADITLTQRLLNWQPATSLEQGIREQHDAALVLDLTRSHQ